MKKPAGATPSDQTMVRSRAPGQASDHVNKRKGARDAEARQLLLLNLGMRSATVPNKGNPWIQLMANQISLYAVCEKTRKTRSP